MKSVFWIGLFLIFGSIWLAAILALPVQTSDPDPRVVFLGWQTIPNTPVPKKDGIPTRASFFLDQVTRQEIVCFGTYDSLGASCFPTGRKR